MCSMSVSDLDSAEDTAASATHDAEEEEQDEEEDSPAESDVLEEEVDIHIQTFCCLFTRFKTKKKTEALRTAGTCLDVLL